MTTLRWWCLLFAIGSVSVRAIPQERPDTLWRQAADLAGEDALTIDRSADVLTSAAMEFREDPDTLAGPAPVLPDARSISGPHEVHEVGKPRVVPERWVFRRGGSMVATMTGHEGGVDTAWRGSAESAFLRARWNATRTISGGVTMMKQKGEPWDRGALAGYAAWGGRGVLKKLIAGDFTLAAAQGLVFGSSVSTTSFSVATLHGRSKGLQPYLGSGIRGYFRGAAMECGAGLGPGGWQLTGFWSSRSLAATPHEDGSVGSVDWSGYRRTEKEEERQGTVGERVIGGTFAWRNSAGMELGVAGLRAAFSRAVMPAGGMGFEGDRASAVGASCIIPCGEATVFLEAARYGPSASAATGGVTFHPGVRHWATLLVRSYGGGTNPHANAPGVHADGWNERGAACAFGGQVGDRLDFLVGIDVASFPSATWRHPFPGRQTDCQLRCTSAFPGGTNLTVRCSFRRWEEDRSGEDPEGRPSKQEGRGERVGGAMLMTIPCAPSLRLRVMIAASHVRGAGGLVGGQGTLMSFGFSRVSSWFRAELRGCLYGVSTADAVLADVEPSIVVPFAAFSAYGSGIRWSALLACRIRTGVTLSVRSVAGVRSLVAGTEDGYREIAVGLTGSW